MGYSILGDEHTERQVVAYLRAEGHDADLVVDVSDLGPGTPDAEIRRYARTNDRLVLTSDKGFLKCDADEHAGVLFQPNDRLSAYEVATVVTRISQHITQDALDGVMYVTSDWQ